MLDGKTLLIANPAARHGEGAVIAMRAERLLRRRLGDDLTMLLTTRSGHACELAAAAATYGTVIALGGDGVVHEVVGGLMEVPAGRRPVLGVIPAGSGNDYAGAIGMGQALEEAVVQLETAPRRIADVGVCNGVPFMETLSFGFDAAIALDTIERRERTGATGLPLYLQSGIDQLLHHLGSYRLEARFGGDRRSLEVILCAVQVGPTYGGGFRVCPDARFDDGLLDVCIAHAPVGTLKAGLVFLCAKSGRHRRFREIESFQARTATLEFASPLPVQIDGEPLSGTRYEVSIEPSALSVIAPDGSCFTR